MKTATKPATAPRARSLKSKPLVIKIPTMTVPAATVASWEKTYVAAGLTVRQARKALRDYIVDGARPPGVMDTHPLEHFTFESRAAAQAAVDRFCAIEGGFELYLFFRTPDGPNPYDAGHVRKSA